jgi:hypothetical protein
MRETSIWYREAYTHAAPCPHLWCKALFFLIFWIALPEQRENIRLWIKQRNSIILRHAHGKNLRLLPF